MEIGRVFNWNLVSVFLGEVFCQDAGDGTWCVVSCLSLMHAWFVL